jgi:hypothetical protein
MLQEEILAASLATVPVTAAACRWGMQPFSAAWLASVPLLHQAETEQTIITQRSSFDEKIINDNLNNIFNRLCYIIPTGGANVQIRLCGGL